MSVVSAGLKSTRPGPGKLAGSAGGPPFIYFPFFFIFLQRLKTSPVIYALRDTFVDPVNKPFLVSLCNDKRRGSSSCSHVCRELVSYPSLPHLLCRWEENGSAGLFEIQEHRAALSAQNPNLRDPCEDPGILDATPLVLCAACGKS